MTFSRKISTTIAASVLAILPVLPAQAVGNNPIWDNQKRPYVQLSTAGNTYWNGGI